MEITAIGPEIVGPRITVYHIVHYLEGGWDPASIAAILDLSTEQVLGAIKYIEQHKDEVMAVHGQIEDRIAKGNPPELKAKLDAAHAKLQERLLNRRQAKRTETNDAGDSRGHQRDRTLPITDIDS
jgi:uncharacterized protein (DUF433 family)